jgi:hypothetical protein
MTFMSSPKRAAKAATNTAPKLTAKTAPKRAGKNLRRLPTPRHAAKRSDAAAPGASAEVLRLAAMLERGIADGKLDTVAAEALQKLIAAACRSYAARIAAGEQFTPVSRNAISATDVMVTASGLLRAVDLAVFDFGMWQSWTGR